MTQKTSSFSVPKNNYYKLEKQPVQIPKKALNVAKQRFFLYYMVIQIEVTAYLGLVVWLTVALKTE